MRFDKFYQYDELTSILQTWAGEHPDRFRLTSIGKSFEGRDLWLATVTCFAAGPDAEKPACNRSAGVSHFAPQSTPRPLRGLSGG